MLFAKATPPESVALIQQPEAVLAVLLVLLAVLFGMAAHPVLGRFFKVVPLLLFAYFVPALLSNTGIIPLSSPLYVFIRNWLLPASLVLLTLSVDIPGILRLGPKVLILFLGASAGIILGGPLAYLLLGWMVPADMGEETWKGLAALCGSWLGGGANFIAIGESVRVSESTIGLMVIVDVAVASIWMAVLLFFAGREKAMDEQMGADRTALDELRQKVERYQGEIARPTSLKDLLAIAALAFGTTWLCRAASEHLPDIGDIISGFTWVVLLITAVGVGLSFTRLRRLEGAGASAVGAVFLYLLVTTIGAQGDFSKVGEAPQLLAIGVVWMIIHALIIMLLRWWLKAPIFFAAVGSQANVGGAASAPVVASAFHPTLAPVGVLLAVAGYVLGTYGGLVCAFLLRQVYIGFYAAG